MGAQQPRGRRLSTPETTPETEHQSRRSLALQEFPTAVPLHFRRPPFSSPRWQRTPSDSSTRERTFSESPGSPTQKRPRRPSTEFRSSNEFKPLYLVEQYGGKREPQQQQEEEAMDEQLPPLPSSKNSSGTPSEDSESRAVPHEKNWEMVDLSRDVLPEEPLAKLDLAASTPSDRTTPTRETIDNNNEKRHPSLSIKEGMPMYELHSSFELLRDPREFMLFPPSPATEGPPYLPQGHDSKELSDDDVDDVIAPRPGPGVETEARNVPLPESGLSMPGDKEIPNPVPTDTEMSPLPADDRSLAGSGFDFPSEAGESRIQDGAKDVLAYGAEKIALPESGPATPSEDRGVPFEGEMTPILGQDKSFASPDFPGANGAGAENIPLPESDTVTPKDREILFEEAEMAPSPMQDKAFALPDFPPAIKKAVGAGDMNAPREDTRDVPAYGAENVPLPDSGLLTPKDRELRTEAEMTPAPVQYMSFDSPVEPPHKNIKDVLAYGAEKIPLPDSGLPTPHDRELPSNEAEMMPIPAQDKSFAWPDFPGVDGAEGAGVQQNIDRTPVQGAENIPLPESGLSTPLDREVPFEEAEMIPTPVQDKAFDAGQAGAMDVPAGVDDWKAPQRDTRDVLAYGAESVPLPASGLSTPHDREIPSETEMMMQTPAQDMKFDSGLAKTPQEDVSDVPVYGAENIPLPESGLSTPLDGEVLFEEAEMTPTLAQEKTDSGPVETPQDDMKDVPKHGAENIPLPESGFSAPLNRDVPFEEVEMAPPAHDTSDSGSVKTPQDHVEDVLARGAENVPLPDSGPATPMDREIPSEDDIMRTTPVQDKTSNTGIAGVVGAVAAAIGADNATSPAEGSREIGQDVGLDAGSTTPVKEDIVPTVPEVPVETAPSVKEGDVPTIPEVSVPTTTTEDQEKAAPDENARDMEQDAPNFEAMQLIEDTVPSDSVSVSEEEAQEPHPSNSMGIPSIVDPDVAADLGFTGAKPIEEVEDYNYRESPFEDDYLLSEEGEEFQPTALSPIDEEPEPDEAGWERSFGGSGMTTPQLQPEERTGDFATPESSSRELIEEPAVEQWERIPEQETAAEQEREFAPAGEPIVESNAPEPEPKPEHKETPTREVEPTAAAPEAERVPEIAETSKELEPAYPPEASEATSSTQPERHAVNSEDQFREPTASDIPEGLPAATEPMTTEAEPTTQPAADETKPLKKVALSTIEELSEPVESGQERVPSPEHVENAGDGTRELQPGPKDEPPGMTTGTGPAITQESPAPSEAPIATTENDGPFEDLEALAADADAHFAGQETPEPTSRDSLPETTEVDNASSTSEPTVRTAESVAPSEDSCETAHDDAPTPKQTPKQEASDPFCQVRPLEPEELAQAVGVPAAGQDAPGDVPVERQPEIKAKPQEQPHEQVAEAPIGGQKSIEPEIPHDVQTQARDIVPSEASMPTDTAETIAGPVGDGQPTSADPEPEALSRKSSKKNKMKNKRKSAAEQSIPSEETAPAPTERGPDEGQPEAQLTPVDPAETPLTSGEMPPAAGENQPPPAAPPATSEEPAGAHPDVGPALAAPTAAAGSEPNPPPVEQPETNNATPHALAQPAERAITPTDTHDAPLSTFPEAVSTADPSSNIGPGVNAIAPTQEPSSSITTTAPIPEPSKEEKETSENMSRTDLSEAPEHQDATQVENVPVTLAQKKKAKKDKKKRRNASVDEMAPSEPDSIQEAEGLLPVGGTLSTTEAPAVHQPDIVPEHPKDDATGDVEPVQPSFTTEYTETGTLHTGEEPVAEAELTQKENDQTDRIADVDTTAASQEPAGANTKPTEEPESHAPATVEPPTTTTSSDPAPEARRDEQAVGTFVDAFAADPVVTESLPEGGQFGDGAANVAPAQDRGQGDATITEGAEETTFEHDAPLQDKAPAVASEAEQSTEAPLAEPVEDKPTEPVVYKAAEQKPDEVPAQPSLTDPSATTEESQIIDSYLKTPVEPSQEKSEREISNDDAAKGVGIAQGEPVEEKVIAETKPEQSSVPENVQTQPEVISEPAVSDLPPAVSEPQSPMIEKAPVSSPSKSKKNKKKHKRKISEASSVASEPSQAESDKPFDVGVPGGEPGIAASEPKEAESLASSEVKEENDTHPEDHEEDTHMSAKAKRNAKKHRKRHSRELHAAEAQHWAEEHKPAEPLLETPTALAEDHSQEHSREVTENDNQTREEPAGQGQDVGAFKADGTTSQPDESHVFDWGNLAASAFGKAKDDRTRKQDDVPMEDGQPEAPLTLDNAEPVSSQQETSPAVEQPAEGEAVPSVEEPARGVPGVFSVPAPSGEQRDLPTEETGPENRELEPQTDFNAPVDTAEVEIPKDAKICEAVPDSAPLTGREGPALTHTNELSESKVDDEMTMERAVPEELPAQEQSSEHYVPTTEPAMSEELPSTHEQPTEHPREPIDFAPANEPVADVEAGATKDMIPESIPLPGSPLEEPSDKQLPEIDEQIPPIEGATSGEPKTPVSPETPTSPEPLSRKASKKQRKKAKKHAKKEHEEPASPATVAGPIPDAPTTASVAPEQPVNEQVEGTQPAVPFDTQTEAPTGLPEGCEQNTTTNGQDEPKAEQEQAGPSEDQADHQPESNILRRLSQREKRKAKEARESMESVERPQQLETEAPAPTKPVEHPDKAEEQVGKEESSQPQVNNNPS